MKKKSLLNKIKEFDPIEFFHIMIYSIGIFAAAIGISSIPFVFFSNLSKIVFSIIFLIIYLALLYSSYQFLVEKRFKKMVKHFSYFLLAIYLFITIPKYFL